MAIKEENGTLVGYFSPQDALLSDWNNAMAEYEARRKAPRSDIWGRTLAEDTPERLQRDLIDPLGMEAGAFTGRYPPRDYSPVNPWGFYSTGAGELQRVNKRTGESDMVQPGMRADPVKLSRLQGLQKQIEAEQKKIGSDDYFTGQKDIGSRISVLQNQIDSLMSEMGAPGPAMDAPQQSKTPVGYFQGDFGTTPFEFTPTKQAAQPQGNPDELVPVINPSGRRVKIRRGQLEAAMSQGYRQ